MIVLIASHWGDVSRGHHTMRTTVHSLLNSCDSNDCIIISISGNLKGADSLQDHLHNGQTDVIVKYRGQGALSQLEHLQLFLEEYPEQEYVTVCDDDDWVCPEWMPTIKAKALEVDWFQVGYIVPFNGGPTRSLDFDQLKQCDIGYHYKSDYGGSCFKTRILRKAFERFAVVGIDVNAQCHKTWSDVLLMNVLFGMSEIKHVIVPDKLYLYFRYKDLVSHGPY